jgi:hypothetical protein
MDWSTRSSTPSQEQVIDFEEGSVERVTEYNELADKNCRHINADAYTDAGVQVWSMTTTYI